VIGNQRLTGLLAEGEQFIQEDSAGFRGQGSQSGLAVAPELAAIGWRLGNPLDAVAKIGQRLQVLVSGINCRMSRVDPNLIRGSRSTTKYPKRERVTVTAEAGLDPMSDLT
jgi:hypothetical protein